MAKSLRALISDPQVIFRGGFIVLLILLALFARWIAPQDPLEQDLSLGTLPPVGFEETEAGYCSGTDRLGRDVLSRLIYGSQIALTVAFVAAGLAALLGTTLGLLAGWYRG